MARIRTIKPEFWTDETLGECSPTTRLLFIGMWTQADDYGNLQRSSKQLKAQILPYDSFDCEPMVQELIAAGCITEYEADGKKYLHIKGFDKHQKIEKKSSPRHPLPDSSPTPPRLPGKNGLGREKEKEKEKEGSRREKEGKGYSTGFISFWTSYKKKEDKPYAFACYQKKIAEGISEEMILNHVKAYNLKIEGEQTESKFIKNPSTFLNRTDFKEPPCYEISKNGSKPKEKTLSEHYAKI